MASKVATAYLELRADSGAMLKDVDKGMGSAVSKVRAAGSKAGSIFASEFGKKLKGISAGITAALGAGLAAAVGFGVKAAAEAQQVTVAYEVMTGSAETAAKTIAALKKMGAETPFETSDLTKAGQALLSFGRSADDVLSDLNLLTNVASGDKNKLGSLALVFGQISSAGKLTGGDLLQLINVGFNPLNEIAARTGESMGDLRDRMSKGAVSFAEVRQAFVDATSAGGRFYQMNEKQSKTVMGMLSTLKDNTSTLLQGLAEPLIKPLGEVLVAANKIVESLQPTLKAFGEWIGRNKELVVTIAAITAAGGALAVALAPIITAIAGMTTALAAAAPVVAMVTANLGLLAAAAAPLAIAAIVTQTWRWVTMQNQLNAALREGVELREKLAKSDQNRTQKTIDEAGKIADPAERQKFLDDAIKGEKTNLETYKRQVVAGQKQLKALYASNAVKGQSPEAIYMNNRKIAEIKAGEYGDALRKYETTKESIAALEKAKSAPVASATPAIPAPAAQTPSDKKSERPQNPLSKFFTGLDQQAKNAPVDALKGKLSAIGSLPSVFGQIVEAISEPVKKEVQKQPSGTNQKVLNARTVDSREVSPKFMGVAELSRSIQQGLTGKGSRKDELQVQKKALAAMEKVAENTKEIAAKTKKKTVFKDV